MICPNCNNKIPDNVSICPYCQYDITKVKNKVRISASAKSKINMVDHSSLVGGQVAKNYFIKLSKKKKNIEYKNYNNYIDYRQAKEQEKANTLQNEKKAQAKAFINIVGIEKKANNHNKLSLFNVMAYIVVIALWIVAIVIIIKGNRIDYYFHEKEEGVIKESASSTVVDEEMSQYNGVSKSGQTGGVSKEGVTSIVYDNQYTKQFTISNSNDVIRLIITDSVKQKNNCPDNIIKIENDIITNYGITAVNLCEMDELFAIELRDVVKFIYNEFPKARNYLTNLTLANVENNQTFIAAFMPIFTFATSDTNSGYPVAIKTQIILNAKYFLNQSKIISSVNYGSRSGYFPPNATRSSTVAHEFGHYLSYIALLNFYNASRLNFIKVTESTLLYQVYDDFNEGKFSYDLLVEAYNEYTKSVPNASFEEFRSSISNYAIAKDNEGKYIYDETIAEAFHDVYLNNNHASLASKCIVNVLKQKL